MSDEKLRQVFSKNLRHYLDVNGYSQADLARHMKVTTATTAVGILYDCIIAHNSVFSTIIDP